MWMTDNEYDTWNKCRTSHLQGHDAIYYTSENLKIWVSFKKKMLIVVVCVTMLIFVELPPPITEEIECIYTYTMIIIVRCCGYLVNRHYRVFTVLSTSVTSNCDLWGLVSKQQDGYNTELEATKQDFTNQWHHTGYILFMSSPKLGGSQSE